MKEGGREGRREMPDPQTELLAQVPDSRESQFASCLLQHWAKLEPGRGLQVRIKGLD